VFPGRSAARSEALQIRDRRIRWHLPVAIAMHDCLIARQFKFDRNPDGLVTAISEQPDMPFSRHLVLQAYAENMCHWRASCEPCVF
jgi:hypothetical protein